MKPAQDVLKLLRAERVPDEVIQKLVDEGYDTDNVLLSMTVANMMDLNLKKGQISKLKLVSRRFFVGRIWTRRIS